MGLFSKKPEGSTLTAEEQTLIRSIIEEKKKGADPFSETNAPPKEKPEYLQITVAPVKQAKKEVKKSRIGTLLAIVGIMALAGLVIVSLFALFGMVMSGVAGAAMMYIGGFYGFMVLSVILLLIMVNYRIKMSPVWAYSGCINKPGKALMFLLRKTGVASMEEARYVAETFEKDANPLKKEDPLAFFKTDSSPMILGRAGFGVFYDAANVMANPEFVLACEELKRQGYTDIQAAKRDYDAKKLKINIPMFSEVDFSALYDFVVGRPAIAKAWADTKVNEARAERNQSVWENKNLVGFGMLIMFALIGLGVAWAMTHGFSSV